jgi:aminopeptidase N
LAFLSAYKKEDNYTVWLEIAMGLGRLEALLAKESYKENLNKIILELFSPIFVKLGWDKKDKELHTHALLRSLVISRLGRSVDKKIIAEAKKKFIKGNIHPDLRGAVYAVVASLGGKKEYEMFIKKYKQETLHEEKNRLGGALGDFTDPKLLQLACEFAFSNAVRTQDTIGILSSVGANPVGRDIWLNFVQKNWKTLVSRYGDGGHTLARLIKAISSSAEEKHLKSFRKFFTTHEAPGAKRAIQQVIERLEGNVDWLKRDKKIIQDFLG